MDNAPQVRTDKEQIEYLNEILLALEPSKNNKPLYYSALATGFFAVELKGGFKGETFLDGLLTWGEFTIIALIVTVFVWVIVQVVVQGVIKKSLRVTEHEVARLVALQKALRITEAVVFATVPITIAATSFMLFFIYNYKA